MLLITFESLRLIFIILGDIRKSNFWNTWDDLCKPSSSDHRPKFAPVLHISQWCYSKSNVRDCKVEARALQTRYRNNVFS